MIYNISAPYGHMQFKSIDIVITIWSYEDKINIPYAISVQTYADKKSMYIFHFVNICDLHNA